MLAKMVYLGTGLLALVVAILSAMFSLAAGGGWVFLLPTVCAVLLLGAGLILSAGSPASGARLSGAGAVLCAVALVGALAELIQAIPFRQQPGQATMLVAPMLMLGTSVLHAVVALLRWRQMTKVERS